MSRLRAEDRRCEKERQETVQRYLSVARIEGQEKKHARLEAYLEQRRAAAWQIRTDQDLSALRRTRELARLKEDELRRRQRRAFRFSNNTPPSARGSRGGTAERATPGVSPIPRGDEGAVSDSGINDPPQPTEA